ncbi:SCO family protein [Pseudomonas sp. LS44]|uniref:SCO family protein n=1 Tax=Pseudomonas sp. LS44 TaxID=1357074 RepID=UPI00215A663E|nr:SCO family protein [Pseudomonas sp. LS44]UVE18173.1 SCO family protein [Pseudomonas sp. LS44]
MNNRRELLTGLGVAALGVGAWHLAGNLNQLQAKPARSEDSYFPNVTLFTHEGKAVRFYDDLIRDKVVAVNMMYASCGDRCPTMTANLLAVQKLLGARAGRDVFFYSLTLQPELDTPAVLKEYAEKYRIKAGWQFLTGDPADMERVRLRLGFYDINPLLDANKANHTGMIRIGNDRFNRWSMAPALADPKQIFATLNHLDHAVKHTGADATELG